ncbi:DUF4062 domain-containing protein [Aquihabitans sp. G128]|uniref:DUF4062 domain-containing protein n=1 Tax=Aquihabitans sp. G128 TaxID=2849779 RepID=UPI001C2476F7|nr:DUF4062 domain-containing protein [Aquihabitans sp. G128]QXC59689.1 DUF4062 domain-containing protein [Aquihabitans sp. G128]
MVVADGRRAIRVFISSTFRDMQAEREELVKRVFPELRRRCEARGVAWSEVDLRWGVTDEEKAEGAVLPICLAEIEHSRPYFIGLIGDRYGWIPDEIDADLRASESWLDGATGRSVTELEILHGVLNDPTMAGHAFFYLRDPAWAAAQPEEARPTYLEVASPDEVAALGEAAASTAAVQRQGLLADLKDRVRASGFPVRDGYADPEALGPLVLADLGALVDELFPVELVDDPLDRAAAEHAAYAAARFGLHVGGAAGHAAIDAALADPAGRPLLVTGPSGTGKSALLATWARQRSDEVAAADPGEGNADGDVVVTHFVGASSDSADAAAMVRRLAGEVARRTGQPLDPTTLPVEPGALRVAFTEVLRRAGSGRRVVLVLDGLDQLEDRDQAPDLAWLPYDLPPGVVVLASATGGRPLEAARARGWAEHELAPLSEDERRELTVAFLARSSKRLGPDLADRLSRHPAAANPLFLRTVLDELRQHGDHFTLGDVLDGYLATGDLPRLFGAVLARWERDFERDRPGLVRDALSLLWAARRGLADSELLDLLAPGSDPLPHATWSPLLLAADGSLASRSGLLGFLHEPLRQAVAARYLATPEDRAAAHRRLAGYFAGRELSPRVVAELPWQLQQAGDWAQLAQALARPDLLAAAYRADLHGLRAAWAAVEQGGGPSLAEAYRPVLDDPQGHADVAWEVARLLTDAGHPAEALGLHRHLVATSRAAANPARLAASLANLGTALLGGDDLDGAMAAFVEQEGIARQLGDDGLLQGALGNEGAVLRARADHAGALAKMAEEEAVCRRLGDLAGLQTSIGNQGLVHLDRREYDAASARFAEQERVARQLGDPSLINRALASQAQVLGDRGQPEAALALLARQERECREQGDRAGLAANLSSQASILRTQGRFDEAMARADEAATLARRLGSDSVLARMLLLQATVAHQRGDRATARALLDEQQRWAEALGDRSALALALGERATIEREEGDPATALVLHAEEQRLYTEIGDRSGVATSLSNQALARHALGDPAAAAALLAQAEATIRELDLPNLLQVTLGNKGAFLLQAGDLAGGLAALGEQEAICRETGNRVGLAASLGNQGLLRMQQGDLAGAATLLEEQERICREVGDRPGLVGALSNLVTVAVQRNDAPGALRLLDQQLAEARALGPAGSAQVVANLTIQLRMRPAMGDVAGLGALAARLEAETRVDGDAAVLAQALAIRGTMALGSGDRVGASPALAEAEHLARAAGNAHALQLALGGRGLLALQQGQLDTAEPLLAEQVAVSRAASIPEGLSAGLGNLATVRQQRGDGAGALALLVEQEQLCRQTGDVQGLVLALANRGEVTARLPGRRAEGLAVLDDAATTAQQVGWSAMVPQIQQLAAQLRTLSDP